MMLQDGRVNLTCTYNDIPHRWAHAPPIHTSLIPKQHFARLCKINSLLINNGIAKGTVIDLKVA